jgi:UDP-glucose:(heptosyl)LPS alpha-1,3-glucosyltransferase
MKIGVIRQRYVAAGGAERYLDAIIRELLARGHKVHVFANRWAVATTGFELHRVPMIRFTSFLRALTFALNARRVVRRANCDLVFSLERTLEQDVYRAGDGCHREWLRQRAKYISPLRNATVRLNPFHATMLALERRTFSPRRTRTIIANSHRGKREIVEHYRFPADRIHVIHNGVDCDRFRPAKDRVSEADFRLLFVGTGFERKGLAFCIRALALLPSHVKLQVVGKGNIARYRQLARREGVLSRVDFLKSSHDVGSIYRNAHLLVHPAIYEPFANVCLEALASGLPVITSRINGASEVIEHGKSGAIIDESADVNALTEAVRPFLDPKFRAMASLHARIVAEAHLFSQNVTETLRVLTELKSTAATSHG